MSQAPSQVPVQVPQGQVSVQEQERQIQRRREVERQQRQKEVEWQQRQKQIERQRQAASARQRQYAGQQRSSYQEVKRGGVGYQSRHYPLQRSEFQEVVTPIGKQAILYGHIPIAKRAITAHVPIGKRAILERRTQTELPIGKSAVLARLAALPIGKRAILSNVPIGKRAILSPEEETAHATSVAFYTKMGFPQFGGRYAPFDLPAGAWPESITETSEGLQVTLKLPFTSAGETKQVFVPTSLFGPKMLWVSEETGEHFEQITPEVTVKVVQGLTPSPHEMAAMTGLSLVSAVALPVTIPKLAVFATVGIGLGEAYKFGMSGQHLTVEEIIGAASVGELVGLFAMNVTMPKIIKSPFEKVGGEVTYQFHQHAPEWLLKATYGKEMGSAIALERQWTWGKPVAQGTAGLLEESYGMPFFRAETLHYGMPTLEWQRVSYMEWLAPRVAIESQWGWSKAVALGTAGLLEESYGMPFYRAESLHYSMPTLEWQRVKYTEWMAPRVRVESQWSWESEALGLKGGEPALTAVVKPESFRAAESLSMVMPTIRQPEQWYLRTSGFTRTPMEVTLKRATEDKMFGELSRGGLSATQELDVIKGITAPSPKTFLSAPTRLFEGRDITGFFAETALTKPYAQREMMSAFMGVEQLGFAPKTSLRLFGFSLLGSMLKGEPIQKAKSVSGTYEISQVSLRQFSVPTSLLKTSQLLGTSQVSLQTQIPLQVQSQKQMLKQMQVQVQALKTMQIQVQQSRTSAFKIPTIQQLKTSALRTSTIPKFFSFPSEEPTKGKRKKRRGKALMLEMGIGEFYYPEPPTLEQIFGKSSKRRKKK